MILNNLTWTYLFIFFLANLPSNSFAGCLLVVTFLGRKAIYHPDIGISAGNRFSNDIQNEGIGRLEDADAYRQHHIVFAKVLEPLAAPLVSALVGNEVNTPKWKLNFAKTPVEDLVPLERTNFFDDGLYEQKKPSSLALNEENQNYDEYRL
jgi:hypothetical protein